MATVTTSREPRSSSIRLNRRDIETYLSLAERKQRLEHRARELGKQMEPLSARFTGFVHAELKRNCKATLVRSCGFVFSLVATGTYPAWKQAFIARLGMRAANRVIASTRPSVGLQIESE